MKSRVSEARGREREREIGCGRRHDDLPQPLTLLVAPAFPPSVPVSVILSSPAPHSLLSLSFSPSLLPFFTRSLRQETWQSLPITCSQKTCCRVRHAVLDVTRASSRDKPPTRVPGIRLSTRTPAVAKTQGDLCPTHERRSNAIRRSRLPLPGKQEACVGIRDDGRLCSDRRSFLRLTAYLDQTQE